MLNLRTTALVSAATGLAHNAVHLGRLPCPPLTVIAHRVSCGHQRLERDKVEYCNLARDQLRLAYRSVHEHQAIESSYITRANHALSDAFRNRRPLYAAGIIDGSVWVV